MNLTNNQAGDPATIGATWQGLPDSFKIGVTGAANLDGTLYLFKGGWYLPVSAPAQRAKLTALQGWPTTPNWVDGVIDAVVSNGSGVGMDGTVSAILTRGSEYVVVDFKNNKVTFGPAAIDEGSGWKDALPAGWASGGWDGAVYLEQNGEECHLRLSRPASCQLPRVRLNRLATAIHRFDLTGWPSTWNPVLNHAPGGRMGNLWASANGGQVLRHDGAAWNIRPGVARSTSVGQDDSVYAIGGDNQTVDLYQWDGTRFNLQGIPVSPLRKSRWAMTITCGCATAITPCIATRATNLHTVDLGAGVPNPTHMSANADGTLWHCNSSNANTFRLISESTNPSDTITVKDGSVTSVQKVASTGFGAAHCLVTENGQPQLYRYDSPYVFKTSERHKVATSNDRIFAQGLGNLYFVQYGSAHQVSRAHRGAGCAYRPGSRQLYAIRHGASRKYLW